MKTIFAIGLIVIVYTSILLPQQDLLHPAEIYYPVYIDESQALINRKKINPQPRDRSWKEKTVPNFSDPRRLETKEDRDEEFKDPILEESVNNIELSQPINNFDGLTNIQGVYPPDTNGDVGPNHYVQAVNSSLAIWDKTGSLLFGPTDLSVFWDDITGPWQGTNDGDPIVLYDQLADRWLVSQFSLPSYPNGPFYELIAVSTTGDPTGSYFRYIYQFTNMPDYPKIGVWPD